MQQGWEVFLLFARFCSLRSAWFFWGAENDEWLSCTRRWFRGLKTSFWSWSNLATSRSDRYTRRRYQLIIIMAIYDNFCGLMMEQTWVSILWRNIDKKSLNLLFNPQINICSIIHNSICFQCLDNMWFLYFYLLKTRELYPSRYIHLLSLQWHSYYKLGSLEAVKATLYPGRDQDRLKVQFLVKLQNMASNCFSPLLRRQSIFISRLVTVCKTQNN